MPRSTAPTAVVAGFKVCMSGLTPSSVMAPFMLPANSTLQNSTNAISRLTPGPARITTIRFHGTCA
jgi:hypothetical protein